MHIILFSIFIAISAWKNLFYWNSQNYFEGDLDIPRWLIFFFFIFSVKLSTKLSFKLNVHLYLLLISDECSAYFQSSLEQNHQ